MRKNQFEDLFLTAWRPYFWIALAVFLVYFKSVFFGFVYFDDTLLIVKNFTFIKDLSNVFQAFRQSIFYPGASDQYYRPLVTVSFIIDARIGGLSPFIYHFTNVIIHALGSCLVYAFLTKLKYKKGAALFFSALFAVHPALGSAVAWIPGRNDSLLAVFALASFIFLVDFLRSRPRLLSRYLWHMIFFALALFTKENAMALPLLGLLYLRLIAKERPFSLNGKLLCAGWLAVSLLWFIMRRGALTAAPGISIVKAMRIFVYKMPSLVLYVGKTVFPFNMSVLPTTRDAAYLYGFAAILLLAAAFFFSRRRRPGFVVFGLGWFILFLLPSLTTAISESAIYLDHRLYLSLPGLIVFLLEAEVGSDFGPQNRSSFIWGGIALLIFSAVTFCFIDSYRDRQSFIQSAVRYSSGAAMAHSGMGLIYLERNMWEEAGEEYAAAIELNPRNSDDWLQLAIVRFKQGRAGEAEELGKKALRISPRFFEARCFLGGIYYMKNDLDEAGRQFRKAIDINPLHDDSHNNLGVVYYRQGKPKEAEEEWKKALKINPKHLYARRNLEAMRRQERSKKPEPLFIYLGL